MHTRGLGSVLLTIGLRKDVLHSLVDCLLLAHRDHPSPTDSSHTAVNGIGLLVRDLDAELLLSPSESISRTRSSKHERTSSIAMTTSTVSNESSPRSLVKCDEAES